VISRLRRVMNRSYLKRRDDQLRTVAEQLNMAHGPARKANHSAMWQEGNGVKSLRDGEPLVGFEPTTARLRIESSTPELQWHATNKK
jgi:hypothetical protein